MARALTARALSAPPKETTRRNERTHTAIEIAKGFEASKCGGGALEQRDRARSPFVPCCSALVGQERGLLFCWDSGTRGRLARAHARNLLSTRSGVYTGAASFCNRTRQTIGSCPRSSRFRRIWGASNGQPIPYWVYAHATEYVRVVLTRRSVSRRVRARSLTPSRRDALADANVQIGRASGVGRFFSVRYTKRASAREHRGPAGCPRSVPPCTLAAALNSRFQTVCAQRFPYLASRRRLLSLAETPHGATRIGVDRRSLTSWQT